MQRMIPCLTVVFGLAAGQSAVGQDREPDLEMGARLVQARCTFCHTERSLPELVERCSSEHGEAYLDEFLSSHHAPDEEARADIVAFLTCEPTR